MAGRGGVPLDAAAVMVDVVAVHPDAPGYAETADGALYPFGFGLGY